MRVHRYPGLFGDPRARGLGAALTASLVFHAILLGAFGRIQTRQNVRDFFSPLHVVDLVESRPGPARKPAGPPAVRSAPPEAPIKKKVAKPKPPLESAAIAKPTSQPTPKPAPVAKTPNPTATQAKPDPAKSEQQVAKRIDAMRQKLNAARPEPGAPDGGEVAVRSKIDAMRKRLGPEGGGDARKGRETPAGAGAGTGTPSALQEVRLRAYYNRLWEHVHDHWAIPPPLEGKPYTVIVSVVIDRQGRLLKSWVEEPSASELFDKSALNALLLADPLPPMPDSMTDEALEVGFRFHGE